MVFFQNVWWVLVLLGIMILIHELGHYWAARYFDVRVEAFSFGFGPRLFGFRRGETDFRVSLILFGGYVKMTGEQAADEDSPDGAAADPRSFLAKPRWQRMIIAFAGPAMNILLALVLLTGLFVYRYPKIVGADGPAVVGFVAKDSVAAKAGVLPGDRIARFDAFLEQFSQRTGLDTRGVGRLTPPWTYQLLMGLSGLMLIAELGAIATGRLALV